MMLRIQLWTLPINSEKIIIFLNIIPIDFVHKIQIYPQKLHISIKFVIRIQPIANFQIILTILQHIQLKMEQEYTISNTQKNEWSMFYNIMHGLGWDPLYKNQELLEATNPNGCFFGKVNNKIVSCIIAMKYSNKYGFIGVYWVKSQQRKKGYGLKIFQKAMQYLKDCEMIGLDGVEEQVHNYIKSGFDIHCNSIKGFTKKPQINNLPIKSFIVSNKEQININDVAQFDHRYFPGERLGFLSKAFQLGTPIVSSDPITNKVRGYGIVNKMEHGVALAPLVAETSQIAEEIIQFMFRNHKSSCYVLFYTDEYNEVTDLAKKCFPEIMFTCKRMYHKTQQFKEDFDRSRIYGHSSLQRG